MVGVRNDNSGQTTGASQRWGGNRQGAAPELIERRRESTDNPSHHPERYGIEDRGIVVRHQSSAFGSGIRLRRR